MQTSEQTKTWADRELQRVAAILGDDWTVWYVATPYDPVSPFSWSAKPCGARIATCSASAPDELAEAVREYVADLTLHLADARAELEGIAPSRPGRYEVVRDLVDALQALRAAAF
jgi:hypothetical protein